MGISKPHWFSDDKVMICTAPTCGISKSGGLLVEFDRTTGRKVEVTDANTGDLIEKVDDKLLDDMLALRDGKTTETMRFVSAADVSLRVAVPSYYDRRYHDDFTATMASPEFKGFTTATLESLQEEGKIVLRNGHGSAPKDLRIGDVPYIKVSDIRAGQVNINPTNRVPRKWAETMWGGADSGFQAFDLICPERASRNIGDFCVIMPGQEQILATKEVIVIRPGPSADFDVFYLLWAMSLKIVRNQWNRVVFMQTNREDVGKRYLEIEIPIPPSRKRADEVSEPFRSYFTTIAAARTSFGSYLEASQRHHFFLAGAGDADDDTEASADIVAAAQPDSEG